MNDTTTALYCIWSCFRIAYYAIHGRFATDVEVVDFLNSLTHDEIMDVIEQRKLMFLGQAPNEIELVRMAEQHAERCGAHHMHFMAIERDGTFLPIMPKNLARRSVGA